MNLPVLVLAQDMGVVAQEACSLLLVALGASRYAFGRSLLCPAQVRCVTHHHAPVKPGADMVEAGLHTSNLIVTGLVSRVNSKKKC